MSKSTHFVITLVGILYVIIVTSVCNHIGNYVMMDSIFFIHVTTICDYHKLK
jgi:hypothetical protein